MEEFEFIYKVVIKGKARNKLDVKLFSHTLVDVFQNLTNCIVDIWGESHHAKVHIEKVETKEK